MLNKKKKKNPAVVILLEWEISSMLLTFIHWPFVIYSFVKLIKSRNKLVDNLNLDNCQTKKVSITVKLKMLASMYILLIAQLFNVNLQNSHWHKYCSSYRPLRKNLKSQKHNSLVKHCFSFFFFFFSRENVWLYSTWLKVSYIIFLWLVHWKIII